MRWLVELKGRVLPHVEEGVIGVYPEHDWPYGRTKDFTQTSAVSEPRERLLSWYGSPTALFLVGGAIGAVLGWLFAPRSGGETREYVSQKPKEKPKDRLAVKLPEGRKDLHTKKIAEQQKNSLERSVQKVSQES